MAIRIMLVEDHAIMRAGLQRLLKDQPDMEIVGEAGEGRCAIDLTDQLAPDVIIMDVTMPGMNGIDATRQIKARHPEVRIVALSAYESPDFVLGMLKAGAGAYLLKDDLFDELLVAIHAVMSGQSYLCPEVASVVVKACSVEEASCKELDQNEIALIKLLARGLSAKEIARIEALSVKTVEGRRRRLLKKLDIPSIAQLVQYAIAKGLVTVSP